MATIIDTSNTTERDPSTVYEEHVSSLGNKYRVSTTEEAIASKAADNDNDNIAAAAAAPAAAALSAPSIGVQWDITGKNNWQQTSDEVQRATGITRYTLYYDAGIIYDWTLGFSCTTERTYVFTNRGGENFSKKAEWASDWYIDMNPDVTPPFFQKVSW